MNALEKQAAEQFAIAHAGGACALCGKHCGAGSFCCGCGVFVCLSHGEPRGGEGQNALVPHFPEDHKKEARQRL